MKGEEDSSSSLEQNTSNVVIESPEVIEPISPLGLNAKKQRPNLTSDLESMLAMQTSSGSVPYGLPTIAVTRRTLDMQIKAK
jgi:hypothetical protein